MWRRARETDSGWVGAGADDDLDRRLEAAEEPFDLARPHVRTVLGPIEPAALGPTLVGEPLDLIAGSLGTLDPGGHARDALLAELEDAYAVGVRAIVALCRTERALDDLQWLAGRVSVHLVAAGSPDVVGRHGDGSIGALVLDLDDPLGSSVGGAASVLALHRERSLPVSVRARDPGTARDAARSLLRHGVDPARLWVGGGEWGDDDGASALALLRTGVSVAFDGLYRAPQGAYQGNRSGGQAGAVAALVRAGHAGRLLLGSGIDRGDRYRVGGGEPGLAAVFDRFPLTLMEEGIEATAIQHMVVAAPARVLTIRAEER